MMITVVVMMMMMMVLTMINGSVLIIMMIMMMMMIPILVTLVGIVTVVSDEHNWKAASPNDKMGVIDNMMMIMITSNS